MTRKQIEELIADMTLKEKVLQLVQVSGSAFEQDVEDTGTDTHLSLSTENLAMVGSTLGIRKVEKLNQIQKSHLEQSPHRIPLLFMMDVIHGLRTVFPMPLALGATCKQELLLFHILILRPLILCITKAEDQSEQRPQEQ